VDYVEARVTTSALDKLAFEFAMDHGAYPATLFYRGYTKSICTSINHVVCHGIPNDKPLRDGDIVNIDLTLILDGWHGDSSRMYYVGDVPRRAQRLCEITYEAMMRGIAAIRPGGTTNDIGAAVQSLRGGERCSVVRDFCGHGLGQVFHDSPTILHYVEPAYSVELKARHDLHRGADDQSRPPAREGAGRRLDRRDPGPARSRRSSSTRGGDGNGRRDLHALAQGLRQARLRLV
jgi:methionyl aminopeptidase